MGNPTLREGMESADGWVEYLHTLLNNHFYDRQDFKFYKVDGRFDADTKRAVEQYQRDKGFAGDDVDGVVGDMTWSALQGHAVLADEGTDGYSPGTYVQRGKQLRFHPTEMGYTDGRHDNEDQLWFKVFIVGDENVDRETVRPTVHVEGPNGTTSPTEFSYYPGYDGPGGWFEIWCKNATDHGPAGSYRVIAQLPMEMGGDTAAMEFVRQESGRI